MGKDPRDPAQQKSVKTDVGSSTRGTCEGLDKAVQQVSGHTVATSALFVASQHVRVSVHPPAYLSVYPEECPPSESEVGPGFVDLLTRPLSIGDDCECPHGPPGGRSERARGQSSRRRNIHPTTQYTLQPHSLCNDHPLRCLGLHLRGITSGVRLTRVRR